jgi:hypothetical protein
MQVVLHVWGGGPPLRLLGGEFLLGRSPDCQVRLTQNPVSRHHCRLTVGADQATVCDLGSRNHTLVNRRLVTDEQPLRDGDWLAICDARFVVRLLPDDRPPDPGWLTVRPGEPGVTVSPAPYPRELESQLVFGTPTRVYISGPPLLWAPDAPGRSGKRTLDDLFGFLGPAAYPDSEEHEGPGLGIPLVVYDETDLETFGGRLVAFLADWGFSDGTTVSLLREVPGQGLVHRRLAVPSRTSQG